MENIFLLPPFLLYYIFQLPIATLMIFYIQKKILKRPTGNLFVVSLGLSILWLPVLCKEFFSLPMPQALLLMALERWLLILQPMVVTVFFITYWQALKVAKKLGVCFFAVAFYLIFSWLSCDSNDFFNSGPTKQNWEEPRNTFETPDKTWTITVHNSGDPFIFGSQKIEVLYHHKNTPPFFSKTLLQTDIADDGHEGFIESHWLDEQTLLLSFDGNEQEAEVWEIVFSPRPKAKKIELLQ